MPILESEILGSKIEINYQKGEKEKLVSLIGQFNNRLLEFNDLKGKFTDNKIILLAALKVEDEILDLNKRLNSQKKIMQSSFDQGKQIDNKIREIVILKDEITSLKERNKVLEEQNKITMEKINTINNKLTILIDKILDNKYD